MKNCVITKLKAVVDNNKLPIFGNIEVKMIPKGSFTHGNLGLTMFNDWAGTHRATCTVEIVEGNNVYLSDNMSNNYGQKAEYDNVAETTLRSLDGGPIIGEIVIRVSKYDTFNIRETSQFIPYLEDISTLQNCINITGLEVPDYWHSESSVEVDFSSVEGTLPGIVFYKDNKRCYLSHLAKWFPSLRKIQAYEMRGNITDACNLNNLEMIVSPYITGDIKDFVQIKKTFGISSGNLLSLRCNQVTLNNTSMSTGEKNVTWDADSIIITMESPKNAYTIGASASKISELEGQGYTVIQCD